ncbi:MAG: hypothetical protein LUQ04_05290 [Methanoregula sp.]|nr:hypothetical protein [Methanoregula sp.]
MQPGKKNNVPREEVTDGETECERVRLLGSCVVIGDPETWRFFQTHQILQAGSFGGKGVIDKPGKKGGRRVPHHSAMNMAGLLSFFWTCTMSKSFVQLYDRNEVPHQSLEGVSLLGPPLAILL